MSPLDTCRRQLPTYARAYPQGVPKFHLPGYSDAQRETLVSLIFSQLHAFRIKACEVPVKKGIVDKGF